MENGMAVLCKIKNGIPYYPAILLSEYNIPKRIESKVSKEIFVQTCSYPHFS